MALLPSLGIFPYQVSGIQYSFVRRRCCVCVMDCSIPHLTTTRIDYMVLIVLHADERAGLTNLQSIGLVVTEIIYVAAAVPMTTAVAHTRIDFVRRQKSPHTADEDHKQQTKSKCISPNRTEIWKNPKKIS